MNRLRGRMHPPSICLQGRNHRKMFCKGNFQNKNKGTRAIIDGGHGRAVVSAGSGNNIAARVATRLHVFPLLYTSNTNYNNRESPPYPPLCG